MRRPSTTQTLVGLSLFLTGLAAGCGAPDHGGLSTLLPFGKPPNLTQREAEERQKFLIERDPAAFRWLLAHSIHNEMSVAEVAHVLGEAGEHEVHDREMKINGGFYQSTDVGYKWGPDRSGHSVVLFFRDGKLINFDPAEFR